MSCSSYISQNPLRQIGIISANSSNQGQIQAAIPLPGQEMGLITVAKNMSLRIWLRNKETGAFFTSSCTYLSVGGSGTCLFIDRSAEHLIVGTNNGYICRFKIKDNTNYSILNLEQKFQAHQCSVVKVIADYTTVYDKDQETRKKLNDKAVKTNNTIIFSM